MGRPAARDLDEHVCPLMYPPGPHGGGQVLVANQRTVLVGGKPAAVLVDPLICAGWDNLIAMGSTTVLMDGLPAARKYDLTTHAGMILQGEPTVRLGTDTPAELLMLGIWRIRNSDYGRTEEGQAMVALLEKKLSEGNLRFGDLPPGQGGLHKDGVITIDDENPDDVDGTAQTMVHEGKHAQDPTNLELTAHEEQNKLYEEQRNQGYRNDSDDKLREAIHEDNAKSEDERARQESLRKELLDNRGYRSQQLESGTRPRKPMK
jgi:uncharacterized Zn-binding protein involved in type VI secretion